MFYIYVDNGVRYIISIIKIICFNWFKILYSVFKIIFSKDNIYFLNKYVMYSKKKIREINILCWYWLSVLIWFFYIIRYCCIVMFLGYFNLLSNIVY